MYKIEKKDFGLYLTFADFIREEEMSSWYDDIVKSLEDQTDGYGVFVDMRTLKPLPKESQGMMEKGQMYIKSKGMVRSVGIMANSVTAMQFKRIAKETGIYEWERYIDASVEKNWEKVGIDWVVDAIDPDVTK